jgi:hypothetical protein
MGLNVILLREAIYDVLIGNTKLMSLLGTDDVDLRTGQRKIRIAQHMPSTIKELPYLGFELFGTVSLTPDDPSLGCYNTKLSLFSISTNPVEASHIADEVHSLFVDVPKTNYRPFLDFSTESITNKYTKFIRRASLGMQGQSKYIENPRAWVEVVEAEIIWCACGCCGTKDDTPLEDCDMDMGSPQFDEEQDCDC